LSVETLPEALTRLLGQHPAAIRSVSFSGDPQEQGATAHLEIETKHGFITLIDHRTGAVYSNPPLPPGADTGSPRQQRDLSDELPGVFADRPRFEAVEAIQDGAQLAGWRFRLDTGAAFTLTLDEHLPIVAG